MDTRQYLILLQRWGWLLAAGFVLGGLVGFGISVYQQPVYQSYTRVQVMSAPRSGSADYSYWNDQQLAQTYAQTMRTRPVVDAVAERVGYPVYADQIVTQLVANTQLIDILVNDTNPAHAAEIANTLVTVFTKENADLQSARFAEAEQSLQNQISQIDAQILELQTNSSAASKAASQANLQKTQQEMARLEKDILALKNEIETLSRPTPLPGYYSTPTPTVDERSTLTEKQLRLQQLENTYNSYQQIYTNLIVMGNSTNDANLEQQQIQSTLALYQQIRSNLIASYENIRLARLNSTSNVVAIEPAIPSEIPISPNVLLNTGLGIALGFILSAIVIFVAEYLDDTLKTADQAEKVLQVPVIGYIAEFQHDPEGVYVLEKPRSPVAESFRTLRTNLEFAGVDRPLKTILIASSHPSEGKSTTAVNLALTYIQIGKRVLLIDADMRRPRIHTFLNIDNRIGLTDLFRENPPTLLEVIRSWRDKNLGVITSGSIPPNATDLLASEKMAQILNAVKNLVDVTIIDAPPFLVSDASILASRVDGVLFIIRPNKTPQDSALMGLEQLQRSGARVVGLVMNKIPRNRSYYYGGYRHYSSYHEGRSKYYYDDEEAKKPKTQPTWQSLLRTFPKRKP